MKRENLKRASEINSLIEDIDSVLDVIDKSIENISKRDRADRGKYMSIDRLIKFTYGPEHARDFTNMFGNGGYILILDDMAEWLKTLRSSLCSELESLD